MCGEKSAVYLLIALYLGSPPRVRGKARHLRRQIRGIRITPACAGKRCLLRPRNITTTDHPRVCGEKAPPPFVAARIGGSPPRVRGKGRKRHHRLLRARITPACAGSISICFNSLGSPPRVRGKGRLLTFLLRRSGITPACAGKRPTGQAKNGTLGDHPRVCGEKRYLASMDNPQEGSPPRVRGKDRAGITWVHTAGITPACAGKSATPG